MMLRFFGFAALALVMAQPAVASGKGEGSPKKERKICKQVQETGSRMGNLKACMTRAQWNDYYRDNQIGEAGERMSREVGGTNVFGGTSPQ